MTPSSSSQGNRAKRRAVASNNPPADAFAYTYHGTGRMLGIGRTSVHELVKTGLLTKVTIAGRSLVTGESVRALVAAGGDGSGTKRVVKAGGGGKPGGPKLPQPEQRVAA